MRVVLAQRVSQLMQQGLSPGAAAAAGLEYMRKRVDGYGGIIGIDPKGRWALSRMIRTTSIVSMVSTVGMVSIVSIVSIVSMNPTGL